jgi:2-dehydro-3-deoxy-D-arabinonate dehydratase
MAIWRLLINGRTALARGPAGLGPRELLARPDDLDALLSGPPGTFAAAVDAPVTGPVPAGARILVPLDGQEVWAAGVTYRRSRNARMEESQTPDHYDRVYHAKRPELFVKAGPGRSRGPGEAVGIRADSPWNVPEPELGLVVDCHGTIVAYVNGNDVSSRSIEGENPLYLPQAKVYTGSCAIGPCLVPVAEAPHVASMVIRLRVRRDDTTLIDETVKVADLHRSPEELVYWLFRALDFPVGAVLLTGTAIVPPADFTLLVGDDITIATSELGTLQNHVELVGTPAANVT